MKLKFTSSLQAKYLVLIICAMLTLPFALPLTSLVIYLPVLYLERENITTYRAEEIETMWHEEASKLQQASAEEITATILNIKDQYKDSSVFWVASDGYTQFKSDENSSIPEIWDVGTTVSFMKESYGGDPYTSVAFLGDSIYDGLMVFQIPRYLTQAPINQLEKYFEFIYIAGVGFLLLLFIFISWLFFRKIRKRLICLQESMKMEEQDIPPPVLVGEKDEVGQLELSFNEMVQRLHDSREREKKEEKLRQELIANLSHDLRTPLAMIRAHNYSLSKEPLSDKGQQAIKTMDKKIDYLNNLIENLLSYTLLTAGKYTYQPTKTDINRIIRTTLASWYPMFENEKLEVDIQLDEKTIYWEVDPHWFERILDNLFQNVVRHAKTGRYIHVASESNTISISDKGPGMDTTSDNTGAGIGLSIVELMTKEMGIEWHVETSNNGTTISLIRI